MAGQSVRPPRAADRRPRDRPSFIEDRSHISPLPDSIAEAGRWRTLLAGGWTDHRCIHIQEARVALLGLRRDSRRIDVRDCQVLSLGDNLSEVLSFERGRSRDLGMNALARRACAYQISMNVHWRRRYIETARNASDADSRLADRQIISAGEVLSGRRLIARCAARGAAADVLRLQAQPRGPPPSVADSSRTDLTSFRPHPSSPLQSTSSQSCVLIPTPPVPFVPQPARAARPLASPPSARSSAFPSTRLSAGSSGPVSSVDDRQEQSADLVRPHVDDQLRRASSKGPTGFEEKPADFRPPPGLAPPPQAHRPRRSSLRRDKCVLELFAGCARFSGACHQRGLPTMPSVELLRGGWLDCTNKKVQATVLQWIMQGSVSFLWLGTPCKFFSIAKTNKGGSGQHTSQILAKFSATVIDTCSRYDVPYVLENPDSSAIFEYRPIKTALRKSGAVHTTLHMCAYGTSYKKPTRLAGTLPALESLGRKCQCRHPHEHLCGLVEVDGKLIWKTSLAGKYPPLLARAAADLVARALDVAPGVEPTAPQRRWDLELAAAHGGKLIPPQPATPPCPARWRCEWAGARRTSMCGPSRDRRLASVAAARGHSRG